MIEELTLRSARILLVDDEPANVVLLDAILRQAGYENIKTTTDSRHVLSMFTAFEPDLLLLDLVMPHQNGYAVMQELAPRIAEDEFFPILVLTADTTPEALQNSLAGGATDFLTKPFDRAEVLLRIKNLLETRFLHIQVKEKNILLQERVYERTRQLEEAHLEIVDRLAVAAEFRDYETSEHTHRVGRTCMLLARVLGLSEEETRLIGRAAGMHDVGKIGIPDGILLKPGPLNSEEWERVKEHTSIGAKILAGGRFPLMQMAETIALTHHEKWDGSGYAGMKDTEIPIVGRITAVADVFDALTHRRPYKEAWPVDEAVAEIKDQSGRHFDPDVVDAFLETQDLGSVFASKEEEVI